MTSVKLSMMMTLTIASPHSDFSFYNINFVYQIFSVHILCVNIKKKKNNLYCIPTSSVQQGFFFFLNIHQAVHPTPCCQNIFITLSHQQAPRSSAGMSLLPPPFLVSTHPPSVSTNLRLPDISSKRNRTTRGLWCLTSFTFPSALRVFIMYWYFFSLWG